MINSRLDILRKRMFLLILSVTTAASASASFLQKDNNLQEFDILSLKKRSRNLMTKGCKDDTLFLDESNDLKRNFTQVLDTFKESFSASPNSFCQSTKTGLNVATECVVDYSSFNTTNTYKSTCSDLGAANYPVSILMKCTKDQALTLEMELIKIPTCIGKSCDSGHLYNTLVDVLSAVESSLGSGKDWNWNCQFYHDFELLLNAPASVIEINGKEPESKGFSTKRVSILSVVATLGVAIYSLW